MNLEQFFWFIMGGSVFGILGFFLGVVLSAQKEDTDEQEDTDEHEEPYK